MTNPILTSLVVFATLFGATLLGMSLHHRLGDRHRSGETKDSVRIGMGSVATMAALLLGLLVASTKGTYDAEKNEVIQMASKIIYLDQVFVDYGPEASECRAVLQSTVRTAMKRIWPDSKLDRDIVGPGGGWSQSLPAAIQKLAPRTEAQQTFKSQAADIASDLGQMRWLLFEETESSISTPFLSIMVFWLALTFVSVGLFAPANGIVVIAQLLASLSIAGAIFLILELDQPFGGLVKISNKPMLNALNHLAK